MPVVEPQTVKMIRVRDSDGNVISFDVEETYTLIRDLMNELKIYEIGSMNAVVDKVMEAVGFDIEQMFVDALDEKDQAKNG